MVTLKGILTSDTSSAKPGMTSRVRSTKNIVPQKNVTLRAFVSLIAALKGGPCSHCKSRCQCYLAIEPLTKGCSRKSFIKCTVESSQVI